MTKKIISAVSRPQAKADFSISIGFFAVLLFFAAGGYISYWNMSAHNQKALEVAHTHDVLAALENVLALVKDAENMQRGYVITGDEKYLEPYSAALTRIDQQTGDLERLITDKEQQARIAPLKPLIAAKLLVIKETVLLRREKGFDSARAFVATDRGKNDMDALRTQIRIMEQAEQDLRQKSIAERDDAYRIAVVISTMMAILGVFLSGFVAYLVRGATMTRRRQEWLQSGQVGLSAAMFGEQRAEQLAEAVLKFLAEYFDAHAGAFFMKEGEGYRRIATYGVPAGGNTPDRFSLNDGLLGQAAKDGRTFVVRDVPEGYLTVGSGLGQGNPRHLIISPATVDDTVNVVLELGFIHPITESAVEMLERVSGSIGIAIKSANYRANLQNLLEETQRQGEELQLQSEELQVNNEELEEQGRVLKESQTRLEQQQAEMEQTNTQLEEQTQQLKGQHDDISRAKAIVQSKAQELEQASQYKSDFLANMSHELRTPLNSSLILAKLLADNPAGNLSEEQVKFAQTIQSSGNDLLALINDILDLSKIEAGHMEIWLEPVPLERIMKDIIPVFKPVAGQKGLIFNTSIAPGCPETIDTDCQRLEQVLKNLMSNAIKFTESGSVELAISETADKRIAFAITDTGIGIAKEQQQAIFEAFHQADGAISRKYGGTGLGLSISQELTRLLGGTITLKSEPGKGSTFIVTIPTAYDQNLIAPRVSIPVSASGQEGKSLFDSLTDTSNLIAHKKQGAPSVTIRSKRIGDDRERLTGNSRVILVVEDDESFARILYDLTHELDFQCLIATTAEEALTIAKQYLPSAVVLDLGLPDNSGLSVLDRLKQDARTRHIPVHVVSARDHAQTALSLGASGYMLKPVKRDQLVEVFKQLETRFVQRMRRVLIVEDDPVQLDSVRKLLGSHDLETVGVGTAAECLERLKESTFDCMVLDLSLPDASGYSLLETLSREDAYSFPPVIVYTGRDLSSDEEQRLRCYSKSIIIKGAKSPERLLDEVMLFLHQVVTDLPPEQQRMLEKARNRNAILEGRHILVVEDDVRNVYALRSILEPCGAIVHIARNGREALNMLEKNMSDSAKKVDLVLMDVMMPEMDGLIATREIRKRPEWKKLPVIMLTAKAMKDDQERCLEAGANDYMAKPLDVEKLLSLVRVWMPRYSCLIKLMILN